MELYWQQWKQDHFIWDNQREQAELQLIWVFNSTNSHEWVATCKPKKQAAYSKQHLKRRGEKVKKKVQMTRLHF